MARIVSVLAIAVAGIIHLILAPVHFDHAPAHGVFFALAGVGEILWAMLFWRRPSESLYNLGLLLVGGLVSLWVITRFVPGPFEHEPGALDLGGIACKVSELAGILALTILAFQGSVIGAARRSAVRVVADALALALLGGLAFFMVGRAAEPLLPFLASTGGHEEAGSDHGHAGDGHQDDGHQDDGHQDGAVDEHGGAESDHEE
jgi:hypothetical protein